MSLCRNIAARAESHMLDIVQSLRYPTSSSNRFVFTMDIKSLYTVIPNNDGLVALQHLLNKQSVVEPATQTLVRLAELVLTLNSLIFNAVTTSKRLVSLWKASLVLTTPVCSSVTSRNKFSFNIQEPNLTSTSVTSTT